MTVRRLLKAGEAIRGVVSMAILTELRDPRVKNVTVLGVEVAPDMREAKVIISVMGNKTQQMTTLRGLQNSAGFLQSKIADRIDTRYTPRLTFVLDDGVKKSIAVTQILEQIAAERNEKSEESSPSEASTSPVDSHDALDSIDSTMEDSVMEDSDKPQSAAAKNDHTDEPKLDSSDDEQPSTDTK